MTNPDWPRWFFASASKKFKDMADALNPVVSLTVEGDDRDNTNILEYFELRTNGPYFKQETRNHWCAELEINIFCAAKRSQLEGFHRIHTLAGFAAAGFTNELIVRKYGAGPADDQSILTCLVLQDVGGQTVRITHFGSIGPDLVEMQATVEGTYRGQLDTIP